MTDALRPICVRLDKQLIEELKFIAQYPSRALPADDPGDSDCRGAKVDAGDRHADAS